VWRCSRVHSQSRSVDWADIFFYLSNTGDSPQLQSWKLENSVSRKFSLCQLIILILHSRRKIVHINKTHLRSAVHTKPSANTYDDVIWPNWSVWVYGYSKNLNKRIAKGKQLPFRKTVSTTWQDPFLNESWTRKANKVQVQAANVRRKHLRSKKM